MKRFFLFCLLLSACAAERRESPIIEAAETFFDHYKTRKDWKTFQSLYADDLVFEDVIFRYNMNKEDFLAFYNWPDTLLKKHPDYPKVMVLEDLALTDSTAIGRGYFTPFFYADVLYADTAHMRFTMALHFDEQGKIKKHVDFIEYPPQFLLGLAERLLSDTTATR
jgi:hypothetical protein